MAGKVYIFPVILFVSGCTFNEKTQLKILDNPEARDPAYQPYNFWNPDGLGGYKDVSISDKRWVVEADIWGTVEQHAVNIALYRLLLFGKYEGFSIVNVVSAKYYFMYPARTQNLTMIGVGTNDPNDPPACEAEGKFSQNCRSYAVNTNLLQLQNALRMSDKDTQSELEKIAQKYPKRLSNYEK